MVSQPLAVGRQQPKLGSSGDARAGKHGVCTEVIHDGTALATGVILASSLAHLALYDMTAKRTRMLRVAEADMTGWLSVL